MRNVLFIYNATATRHEKRLDGARRYLRTSGWDVRLVELACTTQHLRETLAKWKPLGCIVERGAAHGHVPLRLFKGVPTVFIDQSGDAVRNAWNIQNDSSATARAAFAELKRLSPRHFAFVRDARNLFWSRKREQTFLKLTAGRPASVLADDTHLAERLAELPRPCGVLAANDAVARHVVNAAILAEIVLPDDLQVVGINNDVFLCEITGESVRETICAARIREAKRRAADRTYALTAIAKLCGYTSLGTFLRIFKKATGQTLSEFRRKRKPA